MVEQPRPRVVQFYFDEDADARLAEALRRRGYDVETTAEADRLAASDEEQLVHAAGRQRVFISHNIKHFPGLHAAWVEAGRSHGGIIILVGHSAMSVWLRRMDTLLHRFLVEELENSLFFLGAEFDSPA